MTIDNETRNRILDTAERLFATRGYAGVKLRDIAAAVDIHHASLYYYMPGGKKQLFVEVMRRNLERHQHGLRTVIEDADDDLRAQLHAVAGWMIDQPPLDMGRMKEADMRAISPENASELMQLAYDALRGPLVTALVKAQDSGVIQTADLDMVAMVLVSVIQSIHAIPGTHDHPTRKALAMHSVDLLLDGLLVR